MNNGFKIYITTGRFFCTFSTELVNVMDYNGHKSFLAGIEYWIKESSNIDEYKVIGLISVHTSPQKTDFGVFHSILGSRSEPLSKILEFTKQRFDYILEEYHDQITGEYGYYTIKCVPVVWRGDKLMNDGHFQIKTGEHFTPVIKDKTIIFKKKIPILNFLIACLIGIIIGKWII